MPTRIQSLRNPPIAFAHRGARAHERENTLAAFALALRLGASGLETDAWVTRDGEVVLDHDGVLGRFLWRKPISSVLRRQLPDHIPTLSELLAECGTGYELSIDLKDDDAAAAIMALAAHAGISDRTWLCHADVELLERWRSRDPDIKLVNSTRLHDLSGGPERRAARLADSGIDAVNFHRSDWSGGLTTLFHRFEVLAFGWDAQHDRMLDELFDLGIDGVYSDHVDRMVSSLQRFYRPRA